MRETPGIQTWRVGHTHVLQAGDQPTLGPVPDGIPLLYKAVSDAVRPMRLTPMPSFHIGSMTGEIRFNGRTSELWSQRFDAPGIWPPYPDQIEFNEVDEGIDEYAEQPAVEPESQPPAPLPSSSVITAEPGQTCPRSGDWFNHFLHKTVHVDAGDPMPGPERGREWQPDCVVPPRRARKPGAGQRKRADVEPINDHPPRTSDSFRCNCTPKPIQPATCAGFFARYGERDKAAQAICIATRPNPQKTTNPSI